MALQAEIVAIDLDGEEGRMVDEVITLPLRIGVLAARLALRVAGLGVIVGLRAAERLVEAAGARPREHPAAADDGEVSESVRVDVVIAPPASIDETPSVPAREAAATAPLEAAQPEVDFAPERVPAHVSEGLELVESFAEPGAEDGVGAVVHVDEPWESYTHMTANQIIARLADASREELAAVELYERAHRSRRTVLNAAERHLRRATAGARSQQHT